MISAADEL